MVDCLFGAGTSSTECSICHEEYASEEDILRILKCGHRYHVECVDRWVLSSMNGTNREPACPMCNASIFKD
eukprot:jgi/Astpho2/6545/e_gw1.00099.52.1_t